MSGMPLGPYIEFAKEKLDIEFNDIQLLVTALTHRSYINEHKKSASEHNERLEFLGDAVLELITTDFLYRNYDEPEGILTSWRSALVRTESIGAAGEALGYAPLIRMSRGEKHGGDRAHKQILANAFEAVVGAVYLDQGYEAASKLIDRQILSKLDSILDEGSWRDPKSHLQELVQKADGNTPQYRVVSEEGPDHDKQFTLTVYSGSTEIGSGTGPSKQKAQQAAAKKALAKYRNKTAD